MSTGVKTLEEAIRMAKLAIEDGDNRIIINRKQFSSRKRGRLSVFSVGENELSNPEQGLVDEENFEAKYWKEKYEALLTVTDQKEQEHNHYVLSSKQQCEALEKTIRGLEGKLINKNESSLIEKLRKSNNFYEVMTSMSVSQEGDKSFVCTLKNKVQRTATRFKVTINPDSQTDFQFIPVANVNMLPEYLQSEIFCESIMAPVLMGDILQSLYEEDKDEEIPTGTGSST